MQDEHAPIFKSSRSTLKPGDDVFLSSLSQSHQMVLTVIMYLDHLDDNVVQYVLILYNGVSSGISFNLEQTMQGKRHSRENI